MSETLPLDDARNIPPHLGISSPRINQVGISLAAVNPIAEPAGLATVNSITEPAGLVVTRGRRARAPAPISTVEVRRSNRSSKCNGFKVNQVIDTRPTISRVKPRLVPSIGSSYSAHEMASEEVPPHLSMSCRRLV